MPKPRTYNREEVEALLKEGVGLKEMCKRLKTDDGTLKKYLIKEFNYGRIPTAEEFEPEKFEKLCSYLLTCREIADFFGLSEKTLKERCESYYRTNFYDVFNHFSQRGVRDLKLKRLQMARNGDLKALNTILSSIEIKKSKYLKKDGGFDSEKFLVDIMINTNNKVIERLYAFDRYYKLKGFDSPNKVDRPIVIDSAVPFVKDAIIGDFIDESNKEKSKQSEQKD